MGFKVGLPAMKCSLNPSKQIHAASGKRSKTCAVSDAWQEMNDDRLGRDPDIDTSRTDQNVWMVGDGQEDLEQRVKSEIDQINEIRKDAGLRSVRKDAVSVLQIIEKPPVDYMRTLSYEEQKQFLHDSHKVMTDLLKEWNEQWTILSAVQHHDELSAHNHTMILLTTSDKDGNPTFNAKQEVGRSFFRHINEHYASRMRDLGYAVDDCRMYDSLTEEEKIERRLHPEGGLDAIEYKQKMQEEAAQKLKAAEQEYADTVQKITAAPSLEVYEKIVSENQALKAELSLKDRIISQLREEKAKLTETVEHLRISLAEWKDRFSDISQKAGRKLMSIFGYGQSSDQPIREFPVKEVSDGIRQMTEQFKQFDPKKCRIIPDENDSGKFRIAYRDDNGSYQTLQDGFTSRQDAEQYRKNLADAAIHLTEQLDGAGKSLRFK